MKRYLFTTVILLGFLCMVTMCTSKNEESVAMNECKVVASGFPFFSSDLKQSGDISKVAEINWVEPTNVVEYSQSDFSKIPFRERFGIYRTWKLLRGKDRIILRCSFVMPSDTVKNVWLGGDETYIVDQETGVHYKARGCASPNAWNNTFWINAKKGSVVELDILFPALPESVSKIRIYGVPEWDLRGSLVAIAGEDREYTKGIPSISVPRLLEDKDNYNKDDMGTYDVYTDAHLIKPVKDFTTAVWLTEDATYLAMAFEQNWTREYFSFEENTFLLDVTTGKKYKIRKIHGLPLNDIFFIHGLPGDHIAFLMEFEPLPLNTTVVNFYSDEGEPFKAWNASWAALRLDGLYISDLIENQTLFKKYDRNVVK